jgi:hypothetical protein
MIASNWSRSSVDSLGVSCSNATRSGVLTNPIVIRSSADHLDSSRGSLSESICTAPPSGLAVVTSTPRSVSSKYGCVSSAPQNPTGHPIVVDVDGFATTISTFFGVDETTSTRM